mgnify:FL=1
MMPTSLKETQSGFKFVSSEEFLYSESKHDAKQEQENNQQLS